MSSRFTKAALSRLLCAVLLLAVGGCGQNRTVDGICDSARNLREAELPGELLAARFNAETQLMVAKNEPSFYSVRTKLELACAEFQGYKLDLMKQDKNYMDEEVKRMNREAQRAKEEPLSEVQARFVAETERMLQDARSPKQALPRIQRELELVTRERDRLKSLLRK